MKILIVNKFLYPNGGSETYIFRLGDQLQKMGHEVQYFGMEHEGRIVGNAAESYTDDMEFHASGIRKVVYPFKILYSGEARRKIRVVLEKFHPDVVHLNNINFQLTPSVIEEVHSFDANIRIVSTAHDYQWICPNHMLKIPSTGELCQKCIDGKYGNCTRNKCIHDSIVRSLLGTMEARLYAHRRTYSLVDTIICPSEFMNSMLCHNPMLNGRTVTMHNFLDIQADISVSDRVEASYVLYFGRYDVEKGIRTLLKVCRELPEIPFVFAGKGVLKEEVDQVENVSDVGFQNQQQMEELIKNAAFTVFPSEWYENCPFSVMESQMYGTPIIASDLGGTPELVADNVTGEIFRAGDADELRDRIYHLWNDQDRLRDYREHCRCISKNTAADRFDSLEEYCEKLLRIYKHVI